MKLFDPILKFLAQGMSPKRLGLCVAIGVVVGNIPILGVSSLLCLGVALAFGLNLPAIQLVQAAMAPTQVLLIIPFVRLGEWLLRAPRQAVSIEEGMALVKQGVGHAVVVLWDAIMHAGFAWLLIAPPATFLLYTLFSRTFTRIAGRMTIERSAAEASITSSPANR